MLWLLLAAALAKDPCETGGVDLGALMAGLDVDSRASIGAQWLTEVCALPGPLRAGLEAYVQVMPEQRALVAARAVAEDPALLVAACPGGPAVIAQAMSGDRAAARGLIYDGCGLARHGLVDRATFVAARRGEPLLFLLAAEAVGAQRSRTPWSVALVALAGGRLPSDPLPPVVPTRLPDAMTPVVPSRLPAVGR